MHLSGVLEIVGRTMSETPARELSRRGTPPIKGMATTLQHSFVAENRTPRVQLAFVRHHQFNQCANRRTLPLAWIYYQNQIDVDERSKHAQTTSKRRLLGSKPVDVGFLQQR
jgi:hypothetical protein